MDDILYKFRGPKWNLEVARDQLMSIMQVHGFCIGGPKKYRNPADKPSGWPSTINFEEVKHPCYLKLDQINTIIEKRKLLVNFSDFGMKIIPQTHIQEVILVLKSRKFWNL